MKRLIGILLVAWAMAGPARADETAIRTVIADQIEAFQADDFVTAFSFASPTIQGIFRTPENFGTMVREGYPMVWRPKETRFLGVDVIDGQLWQNVLIRDQQDQLHILEYQMINSETGWKINAVRLRKEPEGTA
ncbi:DUF4864 domain-containing protein [Roseovarius sp. 2305UL8-3]|uniref:DUF4864 domain-containing protein n=1 Tax=Roseovarius conchicola TaxID=3121636 RepID=UPI003527747A